MEPAELREILSIDGLRLLDSLPAYESSADVVRIVSELRKQGHPAGLVAAVLNQLKLRSRAIAKFGPFAQQMLFTEDGLEQATRLRVAALHAGRYRAAGMASVADLGCGIGADAIAMAAIELQVTAVEIDEVTAAIATFNLAPWSKATVLNTRAEDVELSGVDAVFLDPARRSDGRRLNDPADWMPSLDFAFGLATKHPVGVKLGPGIDRDLIPAGTEAQWISIDRDVVELGVWFGPLARADVGRAALVIGDHGVAELTAVTDSPDVEVGPLGEYLYEPDGAVIRARLIGDLARTIDARMLSDQIAWITADRQVNTPFAQGFRVTMTMAFDEKKLKRELSARNIGILEIKKRGIEVDPAQLRTRLGLAGTDAATLILTRVAGRRTAILAHRL